jgi:hypothetical protein
MTTINHVCPEPLVLTTADRRDMQRSLADDVRIITELAERIGRNELGSSDLIATDADSASAEDIDCDRLDPIAARRVVARVVQRTGCTTQGARRRRREGAVWFVTPAQTTLTPALAPSAHRQDG